MMAADAFPAYAYGTESLRLCALPEDRLHQLQRLPVPAPVPPAAASVPFSAKSARNPRLCEAGRNGGKDSKMRGIRQNRKPHIGSSSKTPVAKPNGTKMFRSVFLNNGKKWCFFAIKIV